MYGIQLASKVLNDLTSKPMQKKRDPSTCVLTDFQIILPRYELKQEAASEWVYAAHRLAESNKKGTAHPDTFRVLRTKRNFSHYFAHADQVQTRRVDLSDV